MLADPRQHVFPQYVLRPVMLESFVPGIEKFPLGDIIVWYAAPDVSNSRAVLVIPGSGDGATREIMGAYTEKNVAYHNEIGLRLAEHGHDAYTLKLDGGRVAERRWLGGPKVHRLGNCEFYAFRESLARYDVSLTDMHNAEVTTTLSYVTDHHE